MRHYTNAFFFHTLLEIGGVETFAYEIANTYRDYDITIFYISEVGGKQLARLKDILGDDRVIKWNKQIVECDVAVFNYDLYQFIDYIVAKEYIQVIHANYEIQGIKPHTHPKITRYVGVSDQVAKAYTKVAKVKCEVCYNPITLSDEDDKKTLFLLSATRLTKEKGKERMIELARRLDAKHIPYIWLVFTNDKQVIDNPNVIYMKPRLDIRPFIKMVGDCGGYVVQLSDSEGWCYTVVESLLLKTKVIVTDIPCFREMGINKDNGYRLPLDMKNIPIDDIYSNSVKVQWDKRESAWERYLAKGKSYEREVQKVKIKPIKAYYDTYENKHFKADSPAYETTDDRALLIVAKGFAKVVEEEKKKPTSRKKK